MKKKKVSEKVILNKRARFDYDVTREFIAGISLTGAETKSLRMGHAILRGTFVQILNGSAWLINCQINPLLTNRAHMPEEGRTRNRQLLLKANELEELTEIKKQGQQIIPIKFLTKGRFIKLVIGVGRGKKNYDKRASIKKRDVDRDIRRDIKSR
jgi:SsrA-binding protein